MTKHFTFLLFILLLASPLNRDCVIYTHWPTINAIISQPFGYKNHVGVDFDTPVGTAVYAVMSGVVTRAVQDSYVYGRSIMIVHDADGYASLYGHLSVLYVYEGEHVQTGRLIGSSGGDPRDDIDGDGWSSGAHLHFEIRVPEHLDNNLYNIDPLEYLERYRNQPNYCLL